jgi:hypothetical protein
MGCWFFYYNKILLIIIILLNIFQIFIILVSYFLHNLNDHHVIISSIVNICLSMLTTGLFYFFTRPVRQIIQKDIQTCQRITQAITENLSMLSNSSAYTVSYLNHYQNVQNLLDTYGASVNNRFGRLLISDVTVFSFSDAISSNSYTSVLIMLTGYLSTSIFLILSFAFIVILLNSTLSFKEEILHSSLLLLGNGLLIIFVSFYFIGAGLTYIRNRPYLEFMLNNYSSGSEILLKFIQVRHRAYTYIDSLSSV